MARCFARFSSRVAELSGHYTTFLAALVVILVWAASGPAFGFSDVWQLIINTATTLVTFLMVFLIQNTQNRDAKAMHLKLDELIRAIGEADNTLISAEDDTDEELAKLKAKYDALYREHAALKGHFEQLTGAAQNGRASSPAQR